jgi:hypothetical protein
VQAVIKEGTGGAGLLVVKLTVEKPLKGSPNFVRRLLGLPDAEGMPAQGQAAAAFGGGADQGGGEPESDEAGSGDDIEGPGGGGGAAGTKSLRVRGGVRFGAGEEDGTADAAGDGDSGSEEAEVPRPHKGKVG